TASLTFTSTSTVTTFSIIISSKFNIVKHVKDAVELFNGKNCSSLVILQNGKPIGIITERDILKKVIPTCEDPSKIKVQSIMSSPLIVGKPQMELPEAARIMLEKKIKTLPVVNKEELVGIVTLSDMLRSPDSKEWFKTLPLSEASSKLKNVIDIYFDLEGFSKKCPLMIEQGYPKKCRKAECMWWVEENCVIVILSKNMGNRRITEVIQKY
ncbi:cyclic nucleotide-binding/CBS domain-containing protein, partial [Thermoproteota archaeon]